MKISVMCAARALSLCLAIAASLPSIVLAQTLPVTAVGATSGQFDVSSTGQASYMIPIWTPAGVRGIQPSLSFVYASHTKGGLLGPGWSVGDFSQISRCQRTYGQNGSPHPITLTTLDVLCMDGKQLRTTSGSYWAQNSTYQTEVADFSLVTAIGSHGSGQWFRVKGKNGLIYEYGATSDARVVLPGTTTSYQWALNKVSDRQGNSMTITYLQSSGTVAPASIQYTHTSGGNPPYAVVFSYAAGGVSDGTVGYVAGAQFSQNSLLTTIDVKHGGVNGTIIRRYRLAYAVAPTTQRVRLSSIQECAGVSGTDCKASTTVAYQDGQIGVANPTTPTGITNAIYGTVRPADLNGDGRDDLVYAVDGGGGIRRWYANFSAANGFAAPVFTGATTSGTDDVLLDDFVARGAIDLLAPSGGVWHHYRWNGSSFVARSTGLAVDTNRLIGSIPTDGRNPSFASADVNGDGLPDLVYARDFGGFGGILRRFNTTPPHSLNLSFGAEIGFVHNVPSAVLHSVWNLSGC